MVEAGLKAAGFPADPQVHEAFTKYRKSHNDGVFDAEHAGIMKCRRSGIITGLPDAYGRGRIIGDYRRVALYGVDRLIEAKQAERAQIDDMWPSDEIIRQREEMADQMRALEDLAAMARKLYDCDISRPATDAHEACSGLSRLSRRHQGSQWRRDVDGRISTFLTSLSSVTWPAARWTRPAPRCGTSQKLRIVRFVAPRTTTRCSAATLIGRPNASAA